MCITILMLMHLSAHLLNQISETSKGVTVVVYKLIRYLFQVNRLIKK